MKCASYKDKYVYILMELRINKICDTEISTSHRLGHVLDTKFPGVIFIDKDLVYLPFLSEVIIKCNHTIVSPVDGTFFYPQMSITAREIS